MGVALKDLRGKVKRPVRSVSICLDGELWSRHDELTHQLDELRQQNPGRMEQTAAARTVAEELTEVEQQMRDAQVTVQFRGISTFQLAEIQRRFPADKGSGMAWDVEAGAAALLAACAVEPTTEDEAKEFLEEVHHKVADELTTAAWVATVGSSEVPFSVRASELIRGSGSK